MTTVPSTPTRTFNASGSHRLPQSAEVSSW